MLRAIAADIAPSAKPDQVTRSAGLFAPRAYDVAPSKQTPPAAAGPAEPERSVWPLPPASRRPAISGPAPDGPSAVSPLATSSPPTNMSALRPSAADQPPIAVPKAATLPAPSYKLGPLDTAAAPQPAVLDVAVPKAASSITLRGEPQRPVDQTSPVAQTTNQTIDIDYTAIARLVKQGIVAPPAVQPIRILARGTDSDQDGKAAASGPSNAPVAAPTAPTPVASAPTSGSPVLMTPRNAGARVPAVEPSLVEPAAPKPGPIPSNPLYNRLEQKLAVDEAALPRRNLPRGESPDSTVPRLPCQAPTWTGPLSNPPRAKPAMYGGSVPKAPADPRAEQQSTVDRPSYGEIHLDGVALGRWITRHIERQVTRPQGGATGFDPRMSPSWPGAPIGN